MHGGAGDVQVVVGPDHGHRSTLMEVKFAELLIAILLIRNIRNIFGFFLPIVLI